MITRQNNQHSASRSWHFFAVNAVLLSTYVLALLCAISYAEQAHWLGFLCAQFRLQYFWFALVCALALTLCKRTKSLSICILVAACNLHAIRAFEFYIPHSTHQPLREPAVHRLRLLQLNVEQTNDDHERALRYIASEDPDLLVISELTNRWLTELRSITDKYPYQNVVPRDDTYGNGVFSKIPFIYTKAETFGERKHPAIRVDFLIDGQIVHLIHTHFQGPVSPR